MASHMAKVGPHKWCATLIHSTVSTTGTNPRTELCVYGHVQAFMCKLCCARASAKHARVARMGVMRHMHALEITNHVKWPHRWPSSEIPETNAMPPHNQHVIRVQTIGTRAYTHAARVHTWSVRVLDIARHEIATHVANVIATFSSRLSIGSISPARSRGVFVLSIQGRPGGAAASTHRTTRATAATRRVTMVACVTCYELVALCL
jgi:hypothetical protein